MKKILKFLIPFILVLSSITFGQGSTVTPFDTLGWDAPASYSEWYNLRIFTLLSNPGGGYNRNMRDIDSLMYELVVYTDANQLFIQNDTLKLSDNFSGMDVFTTTAEYDTVLVSGIDSLDVVVVSPRETIAAAEDRLSVFLKSDTLIVGRPASGTSALKYNWIWVRKY